VKADIENQAVEKSWLNVRYALGSSH